jgi:phosphoglycerate dehydrogenase-like enzyme
MEANSVLTVLAHWPVQPEEEAIIAASWPSECEVIYGHRHDIAALEARAASIDVIAGQVPVEVLRKADRLRFVHVLGHGIDRLGEGEVAALLRARATPIARANPAAITISEFVLMSLVALNRRLIQIHEALAYRGDWSLDRLPGRLRGSMGGELHGTTLCIAGLGSIGQAIAERARAFGMRVGALTRRPERYDAAALGLDFIGSLAEPEAHLARSQHLVIALPLTDETRQFLDAGRLAAMPDGSFLVNIGRAAMVDQEAMAKALASGKLAGAALDVWPNEAARTYPSPHPIHHFNVIMTPHSCAITRESRVRAIEAVGENLRRSLRGDPLLNASGVDG